MTSPLRALNTLFESGTTCIAEALVDPAAARTNPARTIAIVTFAMKRLLLVLSMRPDDNTALNSIQSAVAWDIGALAFESPPATGPESRPFSLTRDSHRPARFGTENGLYLHGFTVP
jgi:hypothetical protein